MRVFLTLSFFNPTQSSPFIIFWIGKQNYIFNMPALYQRFFKSKGINFESSARIFLTDLSSDHISGFLGYISSLSIHHFNYQTKIYGPSLNLKELLFRRRFSLGVHALKYSSFSFDSNGELPNKRVLFGVKDKEQILSLNRRYNMREILSNLEQLSLKKEFFNDASAHIEKNNNYTDDNIDILPIFSNDEVSKRNILSYILKISPKNNYVPKIPRNYIKKYGLDYTDIKNLVTKKEILKNGQKITLEQLIPSLKSFTNEGSMFLIIDCPNMSIMHQIINNPVFFEEKNIILKGIIHIVPLSIVEQKEYIDWIKKFERNSQHIICCQEIQKVNFQKNFMEIKEKFNFIKLVSKLHDYFPEHFPLIKSSNPCPTIESRMVTLKKMVPNAIFPTHHDLFEILPNKKLEKLTLNIDKHFKFKETFEFINLYQLYQKAKNNYKKIERFFDPELIFLGTNSAQPSIYRNVSSIYLNIKDFGIIMDCGEGTYFQLFFHFGLEKIEEVLLNIKVIYITHFHLDHTMGLTELLNERLKVVKKNGLDIMKNKIFLIIPQNLLPSLEDVRNLAEELDGFCYIFTSQLRNQINDEEHNDENERKKITEKNNTINKKNGNKNDLFSFEENSTLKMDSNKIIDQQHFKEKQHNNSIINQNKAKIKEESKKLNLDSEEIEIEKFYLEKDLIGSIFEHSKECEKNLIVFQKAIEAVGLKSFRTINTPHCQDSHALIIDHEDGVKIVYSGDTVYSERLIKEGKNATILIHEATCFERTVQKHSTIFEAISTGMKMNAWRTILTHFSKGAYNLDLKDVVAGKEKNFEEYGNQKVVLAVDHLKAKVSEFEYLPAINNCINMVHPKNEF